MCHAYLFDDNKLHGAGWKLGGFDKEAATASPQGEGAAYHWTQGITYQKADKPSNWSKANKALATQ